MPNGRGAYRTLRIVYSAELALILAFTLFEELHLRRWLFHRYGSGSVLAGSLPNFLAVLVLSVGILVVKLPLSRGAIFRTIASVVAGLVFYEIAQIWMPHRTFDWNDIYATLLGGVVCGILLAIPQKMIGST